MSHPIWSSGSDRSGGSRWWRWCDADPELKACRCVATGSWLGVCHWPGSGAWGAAPGQRWCHWVPVWRRALPRMSHLERERHTHTQTAEREHSAMTLCSTLTKNLKVHLALLFSFLLSSAGGFGSVVTVKPHQSVRINEKWDTWNTAIWEQSLRWEVKMPAMTQRHSLMESCWGLLVLSSLYAPHLLNVHFFYRDNPPPPPVPYHTSHTHCLAQQDIHTYIFIMRSKTSQDH